MSELAKEKKYRDELIKVGATGNNNLERIRSFKGKSGGKIKFNKDYYDLGILNFYQSKAGILGNKVIRVGGLSIPGNYQNSIDVIDNIDDVDNLATRHVGTMTNFFRRGCSFVYGGRLYVVGGSKSNGANNQYFCSIGFKNEDVIEGLVDNVEGTTAPNFMDSCAVVDGKRVFIFGGYKISPTTRNDTVIMFEMVYNEVLGIDIPKYDGYFYAYLNRNPQQALLFEGASVVKIGKYFYSFGGSISVATGDKILKFEIAKVEGYYNIVNITTLEATFPRKIASCESTVIGGNVYINGYLDGSGSSFYKFNTTTESLEELYNKDGKKKINYMEVYYPSMVAIGNKAFIICGYDIKTISGTPIIQELVEE